MSISDRTERAARDSPRGGIVMCQTMWRCPDCGGRMLAREQWAHQCRRTCATVWEIADGIDRSEGGGKAARHE